MRDMNQVRRNRTRPERRRTRGGEVHTIRPSRRDVAIFDVLQRYRYLPLNFIYELLPVGGNYKKFQERLTDLTGARYVNRPAAQWQSYNAFYKKLAYELGTNGKRHMRDLGRSYDYSPPKGNSYHHELLTSMCIASLEIACSEIEFIHWPQVMTFDMVPDHTKASKVPFHLPLLHCSQHSLIPDGTPFVIRGSKTLCFAGIETDMHTENITGKNKATLDGKFRGYMNIAGHKTYSSHYGFPNLMVPFITTSERRMKSMMNQLEAVTEGKGATFMIFTHVPNPRVIDNSPEPYDLLTRTWYRVGKPPIRLIDYLTE